MKKKINILIENNEVISLPFEEIINFAKNNKNNKKNMQVEDHIENAIYDEEGNEIKANDSEIIIDFSKIKAKKFSETDLKLDFYSISEYTKAFDGHEGHYSAYSESSYLAYKFQNINSYYPAIYSFDDFNVNKFINELFKYCEVPLKSFIKLTYQGNDNGSLSTLTIALRKDFIILFNGSTSGTIYYNYDLEKDKKSLLYEILALLKGVRNPKVTKNKIYIVYKSQHGFDKMGFDVKKIKVNLEENYNDDFLPKSDEIIKGLNAKNKTNLVILDGVPGTGKTFFIRFLTSKLKKNIIFISPDMVDSITDPSFIPFLMKNNDSILIIEDAEPALEKRNVGGRTSAVSNVLNLTDGLLSDCLNISIIATFNTNTKNLDEALLRKGRLLMNYKFEKLSIEKSKALFKKLGLDVNVKEPMTLSDIYNYESDNNSSQFKTNKTGFR